MSGISWLILVPTIILAIIVGGTLIFLSRQIRVEKFYHTSGSRIISLLGLILGRPFHDPKELAFSLLMH